MVWRRVIRGLRRIEYYSANRPRTIWSKLDDAALLAAVVIALLATWMSHRLVEQHAEPRTLTVAARWSAEAGPDAGVRVEPADRDAFDFAGHPFALLELEQPVAQSGWPAATAVRYERADQRLTMSGRPGVAALDDLPSDDPVRRALVRAVEADDARWLVDQSGTARSTVLLGWVLGLGVWLIITLPGLLLMLRAVRLGVFVTLYVDDRRRLKRSKQGLCPTCGYPLRGLEFSERCPECGELTD